MYEERKEKFSFKSFFLTVLLVLLFVFLMLWLFPTKSYVDNKLQSSYDIERLSVLYDDTFADNLSKMKDAGVSYFTTDRLPNTVGASKKLSLQEMYDSHLVVKLKDKTGNLCDTVGSYVEMTKHEDEYRLKVNLSCGNQQDYIIVYLGCYDYCKDSLCEKKTTNTSKTTTNTKNNTVVTNTSTNNNTSSNTTNNNSSTSTSGTTLSNILYEYKYVTKDSYTCPGTWSDWQKTMVTATNLVKVETKQVNEIVGYSTTNTSGYTTQTETEKYISGYTTQTVLTGTKEVQTGTTKQTVTEQVASGTTEKATGKIGTGTTVPANTSTIHYKVISTDTRSACSTCTNQTYYTWEEYAVVTTYKTVTTTKEVPVYKTVNVYETKQVPVYSTRTVAKQVPNTTKTPQYGWVTYYRYKVCTLNPGGNVFTKWSSSKNDTSLINQGYVYTGNIKIP